MIEHLAAINGIEVAASYTEKAVDEIFLPLLRKLSALQKRKAERLLVLLASPPGAGKSTLLSFLRQLSIGQPGLVPIQAIGMDGFHRRQDELQTHYIERDGRRLPMVEIKGAPITFDLDKLTEAVRQVSEGQICGWPAYDRLLHNPVENAQTVDGDIVLLEGNYLLLDEDGWRDLRSYADYTISVRAPEELLRLTGFAPTDFRVSAAEIDQPSNENRGRSGTGHAICGFQRSAECQGMSEENDARRSGASDRCRR